MASDSFTGTNGTLLSAHTAGGNTWAAMGLADPQGEINGNVANSGAGSNVSVRASNSSVSYSRVVFKAGAYGPGSKAVHVRADASNLGYNVLAAEVTGDTFTLLYLRKNDAFLAAAAVSMNRLVDNTLAIKATTVGGNVQIEGWLNGSPLTWIDPSSTIFEDVAANTPILSGNPGFSCFHFDGLTSATSAFDDWTDVEGGGGAPEITSLGDTTLTHGQTGVTITGTGFGASQGGGRVIVSPTDNPANGAAVNQTVTSWGDTSITFTAVLSALAFGTLYLFVENNGDEVNVAGEPISRIVASATLNFTGSNNFKNKDGTAAASKTGMTFYIWRAPRPPSSGGTPDQIITGVSTNAAGERSQSINLGSLDSDDTVYGNLFGVDGNDIYWTGEVLPDYA